MRDSIRDDLFSLAFSRVLDAADFSRERIMKDFFTNQLHLSQTTVTTLNSTQMHKNVKPSYVDYLRVHRKCSCTAVRSNKLKSVRKNTFLRDFGYVSP